MWQRRAKKKNDIEKKRKEWILKYEFAQSVVSMLFDWWLLFVGDQMSADFSVIANEFQKWANRSEEKIHKIKWKLLFREDIKAEKAEAPATMVKRYVICCLDNVFFHVILQFVKCILWTTKVFSFVRPQRC